MPACRSKFQVALERKAGTNCFDDQSAMSIDYRVHASADVRDVAVDASGNAYLLGPSDATRSGNRSGNGPRRPAGRSRNRGPRRARARAS